ncbi:MAG: hypothetical protein K9H64_22905 [Bacteroidales bacterium]|nr:hypothetical protein [Bacteroidales bacterium]MCF8458933.1 hypothetical protein [Bacteroidales bacterium]
MDHDTIAWKPVASGPNPTFNIQLFLRYKQHSYRLEFDGKACLMKVVY